MRIHTLYGNLEEGDMTVSNESSIDRINELILDKDFKLICKISNEFNLFRILRSESNELKHSNVLAWLLNPNENHGLSSKFLEEFVFTIIPKYHIEDANFESLYLLNYQNVEIRREWKRIDILIIIKSRGTRKNLVIPIENKIKANESKTQLSDYYKICNEVFNKKCNCIVPIFLTPDGTNPSDNNIDTWNVCSYETILQVLECTFEDNKLVLNQQVKFFISNYISLLRRHIMEDKELVELCNRIYEKHRLAIDLINQNSVVTNNVIRYKEAMIEVVQSNFDLGLIITETKYKNLLLFTSKNMKMYNEDCFPTAGKLIEYSIDFAEEDVYMRLQILPNDNLSARENLHRELYKENNIFPLAKKEKPSTQSWTSVYSKKLLSKNDTTKDDSIEAKVESLKSKFKQFLDGDFKKIDGFFARKLSEKSCKY